MAGLLGPATALLLLASGLGATAGGAVIGTGDEVSLLQDSAARGGRKTLGLSEAGSKHRVRQLAPVINLDLPPEQRWYDFYASNRESVLEHFEAMIREKPEDMQYFTSVGNATRLAELRKGVVENVQLAYHQDLLAEMSGISRALNDPRITPEALLFLELGYERARAWGCTGVLAAAADGEVFQGRNMDLANGDHLPPFVLDTTFTRGGKPIAVATHILLMVGASTIYKVGAWMLAQNSRVGVDHLKESAQAALAGARPSGFFMRHLLDSAPDFQTAVHMAAYVYLISPMYFIVSGPQPYEGVVITRDRDGRTPPYSNVMALSPAIGRWYMVQTNDDMAYAPWDKRRGTGLHHLQRLRQQDVNQSTIMDIMLTEPVHNNGTVFSLVTQPRSGARRMVMGGARLQQAAKEAAAAL